ncbi:hypothetical protein PPERSA_00128 [Pseudocohnilembus persalinus]|uniref:Uncharacterized protein n=1 Tax=Pseudocohnilembus persalinus TaxID=266149 RepID=A0A0V0Q8F5_PSEPJ|nr:hypothetical protein PPERSA_00128 [Pseudocohnilembus persalinus]|eukprot:KRW98531.1 hypothetical protein PPERSA_00128 [Pseudocohnilembus persalinus]
MGCQYSKQEDSCIKKRKNIIQNSKKTKLPQQQVQYLQNSELIKKMELSQQQVQQFPQYGQDVQNNKSNSKNDIALNQTQDRQSTKIGFESVSKSQNFSMARSRKNTGTVSMFSQNSSKEFIIPNNIKSQQYQLSLSRDDCNKLKIPRIRFNKLNQQQYEFIQQQKFFCDINNNFDSSFDKIYENSSGIKNILNNQTQKKDQKDINQKNIESEEKINDDNFLEQLFDVEKSTDYWNDENQDQNIKLECEGNQIILKNSLTQKCIEICKKNKDPQEINKQYGNDKLQQKQICLHQLKQNQCKIKNLNQRDINVYVPKYEERQFHQSIKSQKFNKFNQYLKDENNKI